jgi:hypothetical protein
MAACAAGAAALAAALDVAGGDARRDVVNTAAKSPAAAATYKSGRCRRIAARYIRSADHQSPNHPITKSRTIDP